MGLKRMFLHAWQLKFQHPQSHRPVSLQAPLPPELQKFVDGIQPPIIQPHLDV
jgi:23S rRNA pseudouridine955/2504/2580 synthase